MSEEMMDDFTEKDLIKSHKANLRIMEEEGELIQERVSGEKWRQTQRFLWIRIPLYPLNLQQ